MEKVVRIVGTKDAAGDFLYWQSRPPPERIAVVEEARREFHGWRDDTVPRLQRVYRVVKQT